MGKYNDVLSDEDIKFLKVVFRYIESTGEDKATIKYYQEEDFNSLDELDVNTQDNFYNTNLKIPEKLYPILDKIYNSTSIEPDRDYVYSVISFYFVPSQKYISAKYEYNFYENFPSENYIEMPREIHESIISSCNSNDMKKIMKLEYDGGGDSGYIESRFVNGCEVPSSVEDFCYELLERNFGGWEINEGSSGTFWFRMEDNQIKWIHNNREEDHYSETFFAKSIV